MDETELNVKPQSASLSLKSYPEELSIVDISDGYRTWATECTEEHAQLMEEFDGLCNEIVEWATVADAMDSIRSRNRLRRKLDWIQSKERVVQDTKQDLMSCLDMIRGLLKAIDP